MFLRQSLQRFGDIVREPNTDVYHISFGIHASIIHYNGHTCKHLVHGKPPYSKVAARKFYGRLIAIMRRSSISLRRKALLSSALA